MDNFLGTKTARYVEMGGNAGTLTITHKPLYARLPDESALETTRYLEATNSWVYTVVINYDPHQPPGQRITVNWDPFFVSKEKCEQIHWVCNSPKFSVEFCEDGCPFEYTQFNQAFPLSGPVCRAVLPDRDRIYHYVIRVGDDVLDPGGGVKG